MSWENNIIKEVSDLRRRAEGKIIHLPPGKMERLLPDETQRGFLSLKTLFPADIPDFCVHYNPFVLCVPCGQKTECSRQRA